MNNDLNNRALTLEDLLKRVDLTRSLEETIRSVLQDYNLGSLTGFQPLLLGHEELNVIITTTQGKYAIKFINKKKSVAVAEGLVRAMLEAYKGGVPVTKLYKNNGGSYLYKMPVSVGNGYLFIAEYFEGKTFNDVNVTDADLRTITKYLAKLHDLSFECHPEYDFWIPQYLVNEFEEKKSFLSLEDYKQVEKIVEIFNAINLSKCRKTVGHYDLHKDNVKRSESGDICFFDLATVDVNYTIFDLGSFIGFYLDPAQSLGEHKKRYALILNEYLKHRSLESYELEVLFECVKVIYASNVLAASYLMNAENDDTYETMKWYKMGKWGLNTFLDISKAEWNNL